MVVQWVKDEVLSQLWLEWLLWYRFHPWPGRFLHAVGVAGKKKKVKRQTANQEEIFIVHIPENSYSESYNSTPKSEKQNYKHRQDFKPPFHEEDIEMA